MMGKLSFALRELKGTLDGIGSCSYHLPLKGERNDQFPVSLPCLQVYRSSQLRKPYMTAPRIWLPGCLVVVCMTGCMPWLIFIQSEETRGIYSVTAMTSSAKLLYISYTSTSECAVYIAHCVHSYVFYRVYKYDKYDHGQLLRLRDFSFGHLMPRHFAYIEVGSRTQTTHYENISRCICVGWIWKLSE